MDEPDQAQDWFVLEGTLQHFQWAEGRENLLEEIQHRASQKKNAAARAAAAAALGVYGTLANSAMVVLYDGERTTYFACTVGERIICGTFRGAHRLRDGDHVKLVVSPLENGVLYAHAIQRPADKLLWLPSQVHCGDKAAFRNSVRFLTKLSIFSFIICSIAWTIVMLIGESPKEFAYKLWLTGILISTIAIPVLVFAVGFSPGGPAIEYGEIGSKIFTLLQFPSPDDLDMQKAGLKFQTDWEDVQDIYMYQLAIDAHQAGTKIITRFDRKIAELKAKEHQQAQQKKQQQKS